MNVPDYQSKFSEMKRYSLYQTLPEGSREFIRGLAFQYNLTVQQFYELVKAERDLHMWKEPGLEQWWDHLETKPSGRNQLLSGVREQLEGICSEAPDYSTFVADTPARPKAKSVDTRTTDRKIHGYCPALSEETVCCNLRTIDVVENCPLGCSYCSIQTFYTDRFVFEEHLGEKLSRIPVSPDRYYHYCTGQSSDSLVWGNRNGNLEKLAAFARAHPNVLLELKTKTNNVDELLSLDIPPNVVVSWTLNTSTITAQEEHFTATPQDRLNAAEKVAAAGLPVAFHFHPIIYYRNWQEEYRELIDQLTHRIDPRQVLFVSMGALTLIKPAINRMRQLGIPTKILQFPHDRDPHGKITYPKEIKQVLFSTIYQAFHTWHERVFFYLCMETDDIWHKVLGRSYDTNEKFEADFLNHLFARLSEDYSH